MVVEYSQCLLKQLANGVVHLLIHSWLLDNPWTVVHFVKNCIDQLACLDARLLKNWLRNPSWFVIACFYRNLHQLLDESRVIIEYILWLFTLNRSPCSCRDETTKNLPHYHYDSEVGFITTRKASFHAQITQCRRRNFDEETSLRGIDM